MASCIRAECTFCDAESVSQVTPGTPVRPGNSRTLGPKSELPTLPTTVDELLSTVTVPLERRPDGDVVSSRAVHDPATGQVIGLAPVHGAEEVDEAVAMARDIQPEWASWSPAERAAALNRAADAVDAVAGPLAELLSRETGKPLNGPQRPLRGRGVFGVAADRGVARSAGGDGGR